MWRWALIALALAVAVVALRRSARVSVNADDYRRLRSLVAESLLPRAAQSELLDAIERDEAHRLDARAV